MSFHPGQRVVCVDDSPGAVNSPIMVGLKKGAIYTILAADCHIFPAAVVQVEEHHCDRCWFRATRFRPVRETNIDVFRAILVNPPREVEPA